MKIKYVFLAGLVSFFSCNQKDTDPQEEDYDKLFPFTGIEKPENAYEDMNIRICDADRVITQYNQLGVHIDNAREYRVTIKCEYSETTEAQHTLARYYVRFVDQNKQVASVGSDATDSALNYKLTSDQEFTKTFVVKSGYPMYLLVNGIGHRGSKIKASISAVSTDGLVVVPALTSEQAQNKEGPNKLQNPYCEYIILP